jgi:photosystem II stability/assembly factor-like uncharacterized protein
MKKLFILISMISLMSACNGPQSATDSFKNISASAPANLATTESLSRWSVLERTSYSGSPDIPEAGSFSIELLPDGDLILTNWTSNKLEIINAAGNVKSTTDIPIPQCSGFSGYVDSISVDSKGQIFASGSSCGQSIVFRSQDKGNTWAIVDQMPTKLDATGSHVYLSKASQIQEDAAGVLYLNIGMQYDIASAPDEPQDGFLKRSLDGGSTWNTVADLPHGGLHGKSFLIDPKTNIFYYVTNDLASQIHVSTDKGLTWNHFAQRDLSPSLENWTDLQLDITSGFLYMVSGSTIWTSHDQGRSWAHAYEFSEEYTHPGITLSITKSGAFFVQLRKQGNCNPLGYCQSFTMQASLDHGQTWFNSDNFSYSSQMYWAGEPVIEGSTGAFFYLSTGFDLYSNTGPELIIKMANPAN